MTNLRNIRKGNVVHCTSSFTIRTLKSVGIGHEEIETDKQRFYLVPEVYSVSCTNAKIWLSIVDAGTTIAVTPCRWDKNQQYAV
jgi:hypothetical protein